MNIIDRVFCEIKEIEYGFVDRYGVVHRKIKKAFYLKEYRLQKPDTTYKYKIGTCWDMVELIRYMLDKEGVNVETFLFDYDEERIIAKHTIAIANTPDGYYWLEASWKMKGNTVLFSSKEEILDIVKNLYPSIYKIKDYREDKLHIYQYDKPAYQIDYEEFCDFCRTSGTMLNNY